MSRVLVTGATGFIGRHVVEYFSSIGHEVSCFARSTSKVEKIEKHLRQVIRGDITDFDSVQKAVQGMDLVIHLAGVTKTHNFQLMRQVNVDATDNVALACAAQDSPPTLIHISSLAAAGPSYEKPRTESDPEQPVSNYGKTKLAGEQKIITHCQRVPVTILRPGIVFGERDRDVFPWFSGVSKVNLIMVPGFRRREFSLVHAADLAQAIELAWKTGARITDPANKDGIYFVSCPEALSIGELGQRIGQVMGKRRVFSFKSPDVLTWCVGAVCEVFSRTCRKPFIMNLDKAREATAGSWSCDSQKLFDLGFDPEPLNARLKQTLGWYRQQGWLKGDTPDQTSRIAARDNETCLPQ